MNHKLARYLRIAMLWGLIARSATCDAFAEPTTIVGFGDSTTAVRGELKVYCDLLDTGLNRRGIPVRVINSGVGGDHTQKARERFKSDVLANDPDFVIIQFGINDSAIDVWKTPYVDQPRVALKNYEENLRYFVSELRKRDTQVVLMTPNPLRWTPQLRDMYGKPPYLPDQEDGFNIPLQEYAETVREIAKSEDVPLVDVALAFASWGAMDGKSVGDLLLDGIHPNEQGHRLIAYGLTELIVREQRAATPSLEQIPLTHSEQWQNFEKAERITDMTRCVPADALSDRRQHNRWKVFEYETAEFAGKCVSVGRESSAPDLTLELGIQGWHAVYIGLSSITDLVRPAKNYVEVKLTSDSSYTRLSNRLDLGPQRRDVLEEVFLGAADLTNNDLQFSTVYHMPARLHYVKTIPLTDEEVAWLLADRAQKTTKTGIATFDGYTWIHPFRPQNRADLAATFSAYRDSDFKTWWFQPGGADLVHHPSEVGNLMGGHLDTFPREVDREYVESVRHLHKQGIDPLKVAVEEAHRQQAEILICLRAAGWKAAPPWEEFFMSEFYEAHPEWRCIDYDGTPTMHLSYAVEEVQDHLIEIYREALQRGADGAGFLFHRGMPMILWEEPFCQRFIKEFAENPRDLHEDDPRVLQLRATIVTDFIRKIRMMLDETSSQRGDSHRRLKLAVSTFGTPCG